MINQEPVPKVKTYDLGPEFSLRSSIDTAIKDQFKGKEQEGQWTANQGMYIQPFTPNQEYASEERTLLQGTEVVLADVIQKKIAERKTLGLKKPLIFLDFGGMLGGTWCKLAAMFEKYIKSGEVAFVVSNLNFSKEQLRAYLKTRQAEKETSSTLRGIITRGMDLVQYVNADATQIWDQVIKINGNDVPIRGNATLVHERLTVAHSTVPDQDLALLAETLSPEGVFFFGSISPHAKAIRDEVSQAKSDQLENITAGMNVGLEALAKNLHQIPVRNDEYQVFSKKALTEPLFAEQYRSIGYSTLEPPQPAKPGTISSGSGMSDH